MNTYNDIYLDSRRKLRSAGITGSDLEARLIVSNASGKTKEELLASSRLYVTDPGIQVAVDEMVRRRLGGEPVAYIVGEWEFYGLPFMVNESVMIPRVDTELLAEVGINLMKKRGWQTRLLDLCAGCGCVGLAIGAQLANCRIVLADISDQALSVCRVNMLRNNLSRQVTAIEVNVIEAPPSLLGAFDAIVCNPPYIPTRDLESLDKSVRDYEPMLALDGGPDGLYVIRAIATNWPALLKPAGYMALECGAGQAEAVREILGDSGFHDIKTYNDTLGIERVIVGTLK